MRMLRYAARLTTSALMTRLRTAVWSAAVGLSRAEP